MPVPDTTSAEISGSRRAALVATLINELNALRSLMQVPDDDFQRLRDQHPKYEAFKICAEHQGAARFVKLVNERRRVNTLAFELAAIKCNVRPATIATAWKKYGQKYRQKH
jgi:hypothetical protein